MTVRREDRVLMAPRPQERAPIGDVASAFAPGVQVLYVGTPPRLRELGSDAWMAGRVPPPQRWSLGPIARIAGAARRSLADLLADPRRDLTILGVMCLPFEVTSHLLPRRAQRSTVVLDGTGPSGDPDTALAVEGVRALCDRMNAELFVFP